MRLTCPNCNAQYEVDERVIPQNGRDVQCSACGHTWYQYPMEVALQMRAAEMDDDEDEDLDPIEESAPPVDGLARPRTPRIDKTVLDVLREEADRELSERRKSRESIETQGDLGLVSRPTRSKAAPSRIYGEDDPEYDDPEIDLPTPETEEEQRPASKRRNLLPDIEELSSTLEPEGDGNRDLAPLDRSSSGRGGFSRGLTLVMLLVLALIAVYVLSPLIVSYVPALHPMLAAYVALVNELRAAAADLMRGVLGG